MNPLILIAALVAVVLYTRQLQGGEEAGGASFTDWNFPGVWRSGQEEIGDVMQTGNLFGWAEAIKQHEGWKPGSVSYRNNNPGNLKYTGQSGATGQDSRGFAIFPSEQTGMAALVADLGAKVRKYPDYSILQIMTRYLGGNVNAPAVTGEGDPFAYARAVANKLGTSVNSTLKEIFG
jgi:hypothetical protein